MMLLTNFPVPNVGVTHKQDNTHAFIDGNDAGNGSLYITESQVSWLSLTGQGFSLEYPNICLHAVSRDVTSFPHECLYLMVDGKLIEEEREGNSSDEEDENYDTPTTEVRFVPQDKGALEAMFSSMSDCQTLHPDPDDVDHEEAGQFYEGELYENEEDAELTPEGQVTLQHLENLLHAGQGDAQPHSQETNGNVEDMENGEDEEAGQFDDAEMEQ